MGATHPGVLRGGCTNPCRHGLILFWAGRDPQHGFPQSIDPTGFLGLGCDRYSLPACTRAKQDIEDFVSWDIVSLAWALVCASCCWCAIRASSWPSSRASASGRVMVPRMCRYTAGM